MLDVLLIIALAIGGYFIVANVMGSHAATSTTIRPRAPAAWHDVLGVPMDADAATIDTAHAILSAHHRTACERAATPDAARAADAALAAIDAAYHAAQGR